MLAANGGLSFLELFLQAHLVVHKDLPEAITAGFQIADVQRRSS